MEIAETSSAGGFENPSGLFAAFLELSFPYVLIKIFFFSDRFGVCSSGNIFNVVEFFEMVEIVNILILECELYIFLNEKYDVVVLNF